MKGRANWILLEVILWKYENQYFSNMPCPVSYLKGIMPSLRGCAKHCSWASWGYTPPHPAQNPSWSVIPTSAMGFVFLPPVLKWRNKRLAIYHVSSVADFWWKFCDSIKKTLKLPYLNLWFGAVSSSRTISLSHREAAAFLFVWGLGFAC